MLSLSEHSTMYFPRFECSSVMKNVFKVVPKCQIKIVGLPLITNLCTCIFVLSYVLIWAFICG